MIQAVLHSRSKNRSEAETFELREKTREGLWKKINRAQGDVLETCLSHDLNWSGWLFWRVHEC